MYYADLTLGEIVGTKEVCKGIKKALSVIFTRKLNINVQLIVLVFSLVKFRVWGKKQRWNSYQQSAYRNEQGLCHKLKFCNPYIFVIVFTSNILNLNYVRDLTEFTF